MELDFLFSSNSQLSIEFGITILSKNAIISSSAPSSPNVSSAVGSTAAVRGAVEETPRAAVCKDWRLPPHVVCLGVRDRRHHEHLEEGPVQQMARGEDRYLARVKLLPRPGLTLLPFRIEIQHLAERHPLDRPVFAGMFCGNLQPPRGILRPPSQLQSRRRSSRSRMAGLVPARLAASKISSRARPEPTCCPSCPALSSSSGVLASRCCHSSSTNAPNDVQSPEAIARLTRRCRSLGSSRCARRAANAARLPWMSPVRNNAHDWTPCSQVDCPARSACRVRSSTTERLSRGSTSARARTRIASIPCVRSNSSRP